MKYLAFSALLAMVPMQVIADSDAFVEANIRGIFYHELGHAVIDTMRLPVYGQEEDAADVASVFLIETIFEEDAVVEMTYATALGFLGEADRVEDHVFWDVHGPDLQRYYNLVCLIYGANPDAREDLAQELELPEERAVTCEEEFEIASESWGAVFDELADNPSGYPLKMGAVEAGFTADVIGAEVAALAAEFMFPQPLTVHVMACNEANAFYDPSDLSLTVCTEFADHLREIAAEQGIE